MDIKKAIKDKIAIATKNFDQIKQQQLKIDEQIKALEESKEALTTELKRLQGEKRGYDELLKDLERENSKFIPEKVGASEDEKS